VDDNEDPTLVWCVRSLKTGTTTVASFLLFHVKPIVQIIYCETQCQNLTEVNVMNVCYCY